MIASLKFIHVAAIAMWCAGLIALPSLYVQRAHVKDGETLYRLQGQVRFAYVALISPSAFVAVASGAGLIFAAGTFVPWFSLKLAFVGVLVLIHIFTGLVIIRLFEEGEVYSVWRFVAVTGLTVAVTLTILILVLAKPELREGLLPQEFFSPGALRGIVLDLIPWTTP